MTSETNRDYRVRIKVFVDFWNFQLTIRRLAPGFKIDWHKLGLVLANESLTVVDATAAVAYQGMNVYGSYDPDSASDRRFLDWVTNTLNKFPGVQASMLERQRKRTGPVCPACHQEITECPTCQADMRGKEEKGVDTRIATDMIKLAWVNSYDVAVLLSSDRDFIPVVEFLDSRGIKVIHGAFPQQGSQLTQACWGNIRIQQIMQRFRRI